MDERPKLRAVDILPVHFKGQPHFVLRDPLGLTEQALLIPAHVGILLALLDGTRTLREIQRDLMRLTGELVMSDQIEGLLKRLDECFMLNNERFQKALATAKEGYRQSPVRPAVLAGSAYPDDPDALRAMLDAFFAPPDGPGQPNGMRYNHPLKALIVPHIDLRRGGYTYAWGYKDLAESPFPSLFVILGIAHHPTEHLFTATTKDFATPLGIAHTDTEFIKDLQQLCEFDLLADEFAHRNEHSVELQVVWLQHLFGEVRIVPILCAGFEHLIDVGETPMALDEVRSFIAALKATLDKWGEPLTLIASVDLSHFGYRFGDRQIITPSILRWLEWEDRCFLERAARGDADGVFSSIHADGNARRVDAYPAVYALLKALGAPQGTVRHYGQSVEDENASVVTFGAVAFP